MKEISPQESPDTTKPHPGAILNSKAGLPHGNTPTATDDKGSSRAPLVDGRLRGWGGFVDSVKKENHGDAGTCHGFIWGAVN